MFSTMTNVEEAMKRDCREMIDAAIAAVSPIEAVQRHLHCDEANHLRIGDDTVNLQEIERIVLISFGKASAAMAVGVVQELSKAPNLPPICGVVIVKDNHASNEEKEQLSGHNIVVREAAHPVSDDRSVSASREALSLVQEYASQDTLVIVCISGGGSALFCAPRMSLDDFQQVNRVLLQSGCSIQDTNIIRKRLDSAKGGGLALVAQPSRLFSLILSDVLGDPLDLIASGPTVSDTSSPADVSRILNEFALRDKLPSSALELLERGTDHATPSQKAAFEKSRCALVGNNAIAVSAAAAVAESKYNPIVLDTHLEGEASSVARFLVGLAAQLQSQGDYPMTKLPAAIVAGGETTVTIPPASTGKGGRNQELALAAAVALRERGLRNIVVASIGTDGTDGPTDAAGGIVDGGTVCRMSGDAPRALREHDAYNYLKEHDKDGRTPLVKVCLSR